ncbi:hypothetical protein BS78_02G382600 [Paspalum vaginatum]|nr:hypothetical protein BS78_02G382600 [Paspalum vaginatum]
MPKAAKQAGAEMEEGPLVGCLSEDILIQILLRLPAKSVVRAGAVCKAWREITTKESFVADHVRRRPAEVVLYTYMVADGSRDDSSRRGVNGTKMALDLIPISSHDDLDDEVVRRRRLIRYPKWGAFILLASCNGVLLFQKSRGCFLLCNPTTRRWAELPRIGEGYREYAFYFHEPSGEYRLLCRYRLWFVLSTGAAEPREVPMDARQRQQASMTMADIKILLTATPVALDGRMHWGPRQAAGEASEVAVFDTLAETFSVMAGPPTATADQTKLFSMEGKLAAADFGKAETETYIDLWFLDGHNDASTGGVGWERRHRVPTPWLPGADSWTLPAARYLDMVSLAAAADDGREGNIMLGNHRGLVVYSSRTKKTARTVDINSVAGSGNNTIVVSRHVFRESLAMVRHPSFAARSAADLGLPPIFWS